MPVCHFSKRISSSAKLREIPAHDLGDRKQSAKETKYGILLGQSRAQAAKVGKSP